MSKFEVLIEQVENVRDHPNADRLSLLDIKGFTCISAKLEDGSHRYKDGDPVAYIPEGAVLPEWLLRELDFWDNEKGKGRLNGSNGDRIKAMRLRGILSQGVIYPCCGITNEETGTHYRKWMRMADGEIHKVGIGWDVMEQLGITKYEPPIPASMAGDVFSHSADLIYKFDVENAQKYENIFFPNDIVNITEKLHGTFTGLIFTLEARDDFLSYPVNNTDGDIIYATAYSKGLGAKGLCFKATDDNIVKNIYMRSLKTMLDGLDSITLDILATFLKTGPIVMMGETFGVGVQDLSYSTNPKFLAFDIVRSGTILPYGDFNAMLIMLGIESVPLLYQGPYKDADLIDLRDGKSALDGKTLKEGIVIRDDLNNSYDFFGRKMLKMVSPDYLTRKGETTELQ
jgi:RNA ligase (TIGR02306 family)